MSAITALSNLSSFDVIYNQQQDSVGTEECLHKFNELNNFCLNSKSKLHTKYRSVLGLNFLFMIESARKAAEINAEFPYFVNAKSCCEYNHEVWTYSLGINFQKLNSTTNSAFLFSYLFYVFTASKYSIFLTRIKPIIPISRLENVELIKYSKNCDRRTKLLCHSFFNSSNYMHKELEIFCNDPSNYNSTLYASELSEVHRVAKSIM